MSETKGAKVIAVIREYHLVKVEAEDGFQYVIREKDFPSEYQRLDEGMTLDIVVDDFGRVLNIL